ncbi:MFS transporter [Cupriavidus lacunae]|uniref:MFS transporter n=1 Tax=Cupriavidus lacunae TaxID=2666307 RepID=A0A370NIE7_9BURK|nr:MFS transporter [Cupriavidus lacunae]RDK05391.1 MFS transporter [Cupriavidus lacunae]
MNEPYQDASMSTLHARPDGQTAREPSASVSGPAVTTHYSGTRKVVLLIALLAAWVLANADRIAMTISIIPMRTEFSLDAREAGLVLSSFHVTYALTNLAAGWMADKFGSRRVLVFCVASWSLFTSLTGFAWSLASLVAIRGLFGIGEGGFSPSSSVTIAEAFPKERRARPKSLIIGATFIGSAIGSGWIASMIHTHGWRFAYHVLGGAGIVMAVILWFVIKDSPLQDPSVKKAARPGLKALFRTPILRRTALIFFFANMLNVGLISWMPTYLVQTKQVHLLTAGVAASLPFVFSFISLNVVGWLLDRYGEKRERLFLAGGAFSMMVFMALMVISSELWVLMTFWTLCMMSFTFVYGTVFAIPLKHLPDSLIGTAAGVVNFGGQLASAISPTVMGFLIVHAAGSFVPAFLFLIAAGVCCFLVSITWTNRGSQMA